MGGGYIGKKESRNIPVRRRTSEQKRRNTLVSQIDTRLDRSRVEVWLCFDVGVRRRAQPPGARRPRPIRRASGWYSRRHKCQDQHPGAVLCSYAEGTVDRVEGKNSIIGSLGALVDMHRPIVSMLTYSTTRAELNMRSTSDRFMYHYY